ncbi:MAG: hypothetical protein GXY32_01355 [Ruminococcaceae bacterium]|nr:hypothetical protein [Oscillospiraceae bacterium]
MRKKNNAFGMDARQREEKRRKRYEKPIWRSIAGLLLAWQLLIVAGLAWLSFSAQQAHPLAGTFGSLLLAALLPGVPLTVLCTVQWVRIKKGLCGETPQLYLGCGVVGLGVMALLLIAWAITAILGV